MLEALDIQDNAAGARAPLRASRSSSKIDPQGAVAVAADVPAIGGAK